MEVKININNYPKQKDKIVEELRKKFLKKKTSETFDENKIEFFYSYGMNIGNNDWSTFENYLNSTVGGSYYGKYGRLISDCDGDYPQELIDSLKPFYDNKMNEERTKENKENFLSEILVGVGKTPRFSKEKPPAVMNGEEFLMNFFNRVVPIYPTLEELKQVKPEIYELYSKMTDNLIAFNPANETANEHGFVIHTIVGAYRKDKSVFIVGNESNIDVYELFDEEPDTIYWKFDQGHQKDTIKFRTVQPGDTFGKCYRLTDAEVNSLKGKIYLQSVDIQRRPQSRGVTNHGNGLFQINL